MSSPDAPAPPPGPSIPAGMEGLPLDVFPLGVTIADGQGRILQTNAAASRLLGLSPSEHLGRTTRSPEWNLVRADGSPLAAEDYPAVRAFREQRRIDEAEVGVLRPDGDQVWLSITAVPLGADRVLITYGDVSETHRSKAILAARSRLAEQAPELPLGHLLRTMLDEAEALTGSIIGFYHLVAEDQEHLHLQAWSTRTEAEFCRAEGEGGHHPVAQAGVWAEAIRTGAPQIHNDYGNLQGRKGLPPGHAEVAREVIVPVLRAGRVVALLGVGNKATDYREADVDAAQRLADLAWDLVASKRAQEAQRGSALRYATLFNAAPLGIVLSQHGAYLQANPAFLSLFGHRQESEILGQPLLNHIEAQQRGLVRERNEQRELTGSGPMAYEMMGLRTDGTSFPMEIQATTVPLEDGAGTLAFISDISERKQIEQKLRDSEATFRSYVEQSIDVIFTLDARGTFTFMSPAWERHFGMPVAAVLGKPFAPFVHPEDVQPCMAYLQRVLSTGQVEMSPPYRVRRADGAWRWFVANGAAMATQAGEPQFIGVARDITEGRRAEEALRESEEQLQIIFEASEAGIILVSSKGEIRFANRRMGEMFGVAAQALIGTTYLEHLHDSEKQLGDERMHQLVKGEIQSVSVERRYVRTDGTEFWGHLSGRRLEHPDGSLRALVGVITDISDRKRMEEERLAIEQKMQQAQKMESLGSLAGGVAHDMNNVLAAILGLASAHIEDQPEGAPARQAFGTIIKAAERGGNMVKSLLSLARQSPSERREVDLNALLREEVDLLERTTLAKVRLVLDLAPGLRPIQGDGSALAHAFMNLCVNAVEAMQEDGTLTLGTLDLGPDGIEVRVEDTGAGMSQEVLEKALDPFFTTKAVGKGTGLGLSMVYSTVKAHQGQIEIHSLPGKGTRVVMRFPACDPGPQAVEPAPPRPSQGNLDVLLVDDDELVQNSIQAILRALGHTVTPAISGEEALAKLEAGLRPDVIILDMNMPGLGGTGTLPRLRALNPAVPVLLATGRADQTALDLVDAHPHVTLLSKPFSMKDLQRHLEPLVRKG